MEFASPSHGGSSAIEQKQANRQGLGKTIDSSSTAAANNAAWIFAVGGAHSAEKIETTLGDLIVALTEETHHWVANEREAYELVAYLLSERLSRAAS
jgi:hypothetical protein